MVQILILLRVIRYNNMVISVIRNLKGVKYPHGYKAKQCIWLRSQLFEREEVRGVRIIQGKQDCSGVCEMQGL